MKKLMLAFLSLVLMSGCNFMEKSYCLDKEFGQAQQVTWNNMIADPNPGHADKAVAGVAGIHAEGIMDVYNKSFQEPPHKTTINLNLDNNSTGRQ